MTSDCLTEMLVSLPSYAGYTLMWLLLTATPLNHVTLHHAIECKIKSLDIHIMPLWSIFIDKRQ